MLFLNQILYEQFDQNESVTVTEAEDLSKRTGLVSKGPTQGQRLKTTNEQSETAS